MSAALLPEALAPLREDPTRAAVLLDVDGTLAPIVQRAEEAHVPEPTRQLVIEAAKRYALVIIVSGRRAADARAMVSIGSLFYIGSHGAELIRPGTGQVIFDPQVEAWSGRIHEFGRQLDHNDMRRRRVRLEDKGPILTFHWRGAPDEDAAQATVDAIATRAERAGLRTHWGRKILEVRPPVEFDKGSGIASLLGEFDLHAAMYVGDDRTDLDAFRALKRLADEGEIDQVVRVAVSSEEGPAEIKVESDLVVDGTDGVRRLLEMLVA